MPLFKFSQDSTGRGSLSLPRIIVEGRQAAVGTFLLPCLQIVGSGTFDGLGSGTITLPLLAISGFGIVDAVPDGAGKGTITIPCLQVSGVGSQGEGLGAGTLVLPLLGVSGRGGSVPVFDFGDETDGVLRHESRRQLI